MKRLGFRILNAFDPKKMDDTNSKPVTESTTGIPLNHVSFGNLSSGMSSRSSTSSSSSIRSQTPASKRNSHVSMAETGMFLVSNKNINVS